MRKAVQQRCSTKGFQTRSTTDGKQYIEGYFAVFDSNYEMWEGASESIARGAFDTSLDRDIRCLIDHDTRLVLGRTTANTLEIRVDDVGLWGCVEINPSDGDAMNLYERVKRGDVSQCSIGFMILREDVDTSHGKYHWTIREVELYEVSVVTFPAYEETGVSARKAQIKDINKRKNEQRKMQMMAKLKGEK